MTADGATTLIEIRISRVLLADGGMAVRVATPADGYSAVELLGLLEAAKFQIYADMTSGDCT